MPSSSRKKATATHMASPIAARLNLVMASEKELSSEQAVGTSLPGKKDSKGVPQLYSMNPRVTSKLLKSPSATNKPQRIARPQTAISRGRFLGKPVVGSPGVGCGGSSSENERSEGCSSFCKTSRLSVELLVSDGVFWDRSSCPQWRQNLSSDTFLIPHSGQKLNEATMC